MLCELETIKIGSIMCGRNFLKVNVLVEFVYSNFTWESSLDLSEILLVEKLFGD